MGELRRDGKRLDNIYGGVCKKSWKFRDLLQMLWLNWSREETGGVR
jgi:hypothetical protein